MSGFLNKLKRKGKDAVEDVTEVFTSPFEIKELEEINKDLLKDVDEEIAAHATAVQKEEADALEQALFARILEKYDRKSSRKLKREPTADENDNINVYKRKLQRGLTARSGNIFSKFSSSVLALNDAAANSLRLAVESLAEFEASVQPRLPLLNENLEEEIASNQASITDQVQNSFPGGVAAIDSYDDHLPEGIPNWNTFQAQFQASADSLRALNVTRTEESRAKAFEILAEAQKQINDLDAAFRARFPLLPATLDNDLDTTLGQINDYVNSSFPGGLEKLDLYDDNLPEGIPSWEQLLVLATDQSASLSNANSEAIDAAKAAKKAEIYSQFLAQIEAAMNASNDAIDNSALDYLNDEDRGIFRAILKGQVQAVQVNAASALAL
jgi:hypothetical protein